MFGGLKSAFSNTVSAVRDPIQSFQNLGGNLAQGTKNLSKIDPSKALADKVGLGQFKPQDVKVNESPFTDTKKTDELRRNFARQLHEVQARKINPMSAAQVGAAAQVGDAKTIEQAAAMKAAQINEANQEQIRAQQLSLAQQLQAQASGQGPSLAQMQLQQGRDQNIATAMALAASQRGMTAGQGLRQIADQTANANQAAAQEAARLRLAEQLQAQQALQGVLSGTREQDIGLATNQAGLQQQANLQNAGFDQQRLLANQEAQNQFLLRQADLNQSGILKQADLDQSTNVANQNAFLNMLSLNDAQARSLNQNIAGLTQDDINRLMELERLKVQTNLGVQGLGQAGFASGQQAKSQFIGKLGEAGVAAATGGKGQ